MKTLVTLSIIFTTSFASAFGFSDITTWAGSGSSQAAIVIDWADGSPNTSMVWGYRWNGTTTGLDMLSSIMAIDPKLSRAMGGGGPNTIFGLGYDTDGDGLPLTGSGEFLSPADAGDHFREGWFEAGFWASWVAGGSSELPSIWSFGSGNFLAENLVNQDWKGWSFGAAPTWNALPPVPPSNPVPEPTTLIALGAGAAGLIRRRSARRRP